MWIQKGGLRTGGQGPNRQTSADEVKPRGKFPRKSTGYFLQRQATLHCVASFFYTSYPFSALKPHI